MAEVNSTEYGKWLFINPDTYVQEESSKALESLITNKSLSLDIDKSLSALAYGEKEKTIKFFNNVIDQPVEDKYDHPRIRSLIIDYYSSHKSIVTKSKKFLDFNVLTNRELNELILSFGFPYPRHILTRKNKIEFLLKLIELYQKKGTAETLAKVLQFYGLKNIVVSEWWIKYDKDREDDYGFFALSNPIYPFDLKNQKEYIIDKTYSDFIENNPHWHLPLEKLKYYYNLTLSDYKDKLLQQTDSSLKRLNYYYTSVKSASLGNKNKISLPSIAPVISIQSSTRITDLDIAIAIIQRKIEESYNFWTGYTLIPIVPNKFLSPYPTYIPDVFVGPLMIAREAPTYDEFLSDPLKWATVLVSPNASGTFEGHEKMIAYGPHPEVIDGETMTSYSFIEMDEGFTILAHEDSDDYANNILSYWYHHANTPAKEKIEGTNKWKVFSVPIHSIATVEHFNTFVTTSRVYNGESWIDLSGIIPSCKLTNLNENLYRDIALNGFTETYSILEIVLAITYLHQRQVIQNYAEIDPMPTLFYSDTKRHHLFYDYRSDSPDYPVLDEPTSEKDNDSACYGNIYYRDDIDKFQKSTNKYKSILDYYFNLIYDDPNKVLGKKSYRHNSDGDIENTQTNMFYTEWQPYFRKKERLKIYDSLYFKPNKFDEDDVLFALTNSEAFLKAINPKFYEELIDALSANPDDLLENIMLDFEYYLTEELEIIDIPFTYVLRGGDFYNSKLKPVVNFFKPFRVKILDFLTSFSIDNPLTDSCLVGDSIETTDINDVLVDKPLARSMDYIYEIDGTNLPTFMGYRDIETYNDRTDDSWISDYRPINDVNRDLAKDVTPNIYYDRSLFDYGHCSDDIITHTHIIIEELKHEITGENEEVIRAGVLDIGIKDSLFIKITDPESGEHEVSIDDQQTTFDFIDIVLDGSGDENYEDLFLTTERAILHVDAKDYEYPEDESIIPSMDLIIYHDFSGPGVLRIWTLNEDTMEETEVFLQLYTPLPESVIRYDDFNISDYLTLIENGPMYIGIHDSRGQIIRQKISYGISLLVEKVTGENSGDIGGPSE